MTPPMGENQPLIYNGKEDPQPDIISESECNTTTKKICQSDLFKLLIVAVLAVLITHLYDQHVTESRNIATNNGLPPAPTLPEEIQVESEGSSPKDGASTTISKVQYRPYCMTYDTQKTARILQTSMGSPSQQWSRIPCYAQPDKVRLWTRGKPAPLGAHLNEYGNPDAILNISLGGTPAFADRPPILGFGAAFTEASAVNYQSLPEKSKETLMELYFGKSGLGYALGRVHINSCDFSVNSYNFDEVDGDFDLEHFDMKVTHDNQPDGMMDMIRRATDVFENSWKQLDPGDDLEDPEEVDSTKDGTLLMYASPWSPPAWMKNPTYEDSKNATHAAKMTGSTEPSCLRDGTGRYSRYAKAWALYFSKFITAYRKHGIPLWAITVQNEPEFPAPWEACAYTPKTQADFVAYHLGPQLKQDHPDVKVFMFDHNKDHMIQWAKLLLNESAHPAFQYIDGTAYHWYAGGMDRLLDGGVGSPNLHRFQSTLQDLFAAKEEVSKNNTAISSDMQSGTTAEAVIKESENSQGDEHIILGSEACHCPYTGYAGGDIEIYWARAERYAHTILADLAAGSNGWVEWNLLLDSVGGPNHLNNLCDTGILAVPHRAIVNGTESTIPPTLPFEKTKHKFGVNVGDTRTKAELNALGFPAKYLDDGLAVQPIYFYMGHISRYVRPGSKALSGLIEEAKVENNDKKLSTTPHRAFRSEGQVVPGGGFNDLARNGIEITAWPCEGSTRQVFHWDEDTNRIEVLGHDWLGNRTKSCLAKEVDKSFKGITLTECKARSAATFDMVQVPNKEEEDDNEVQFIQTNVPARSKVVDRCLILGDLGNNGGAFGPRGGAPVKYGSCASTRSKWKYSDPIGGEIISTLKEGEVCMTTGWPFLQMGAFATPNGESESTVVLLNEARDSANYVLYDGDEALLSGSIPPRSIQTILLDTN